jgi:hypothetical protein
VEDGTRARAEAAPENRDSYVRDVTSPPMARGRAALGRDVNDDDRRPVDRSARVDDLEVAHRVIELAEA